MKKITALCLAIILMLSLAACAGGATPGAATPAAPVNTAGAPAAPAPVQGEFKLRLCHPFLASSMINESVVLFKQQVEEQSGGRILVEVYSDASLMPTDQMIPAVLDGTIEATSMYAFNLVNISPMYRIFDMPMIFGDTDVCIDNIMDFYKSDTFQNECLVDFENAGFKYYPTIQDVDRSIWTTEKEVTTADGFQGMKIRSVGGIGAELLAKAWGFSSITISSTELPTALMQGTVAGAIIGSVYGYDTKPPALKYCIMAQTDYAGTNGLIISKEWYDKLPADLQTVIDEAGMMQFQWTLEQTVDRAQQNTKENGRIETDMGVQVVFLSEEVRQQLWDKYAPVLADFCKDNERLANFVAIANSEYNIYSQEYKDTH